MNGKENDVKLAVQLRDTFIKQYNDDRSFENLLDELKVEYEERFVHRASKELDINIVSTYKALKGLVDEVKTADAKAIFEEACKIKDARTWINDNGKHIMLVSEIFFNFYKEAAKKLTIN